MNSKIFLVSFVGLFIVHITNGDLQWDPSRGALDQSLYENAIDPELCREQVHQINRNSQLRLRFADAGIRTPRGIFTGNIVDLGNYHQCLEINEEMQGSVLQGKYCMIRVPVNQNVDFPNLPTVPDWLDFDVNSFFMDNETVRTIEKYQTLQEKLHMMTGELNKERSIPETGPLHGVVLRLAVCIPKSCSTEQAITSLLFNLTAVGFKYEDEFCRLPNDKPWVPVDYAFVIVSSIIGLLTLLSTSYDLLNRFILKRDAKQASVIGTSFSVYTNGRRLMTFTSDPNTLDCLDGIRALAMIWVIVGHTFAAVPMWSNIIYIFTWLKQPEAIWLWVAHITVDTFFLLSGLLVVFSTAGKLKGNQLLSNIHLFYLNRLLRMFPLLAMGVLLEASYVNRMTDGPYWGSVMDRVDRCRTFWWSTLLHVHNYLNPRQRCVAQTWYLAIDVQLHILSPIILYWVLSGKKTKAWIALASGLTVWLVASTIFNFIMELPSGTFPSTRRAESARYLSYYYVNTLTRGAPFFVGMIFGYILHLHRNKDNKLAKAIVALLWACATGLLSTVLYASYPIIHDDWDNQTLDSLYNSFIRPMWAAGLGCLIFVCVQGYGGPINWFLSLHIWKLPSRLSYAMYIFHYFLIVGIQSSALVPTHFSPGLILFSCLAHFALTFAFSFFMTLLVDSPFSTLFKLLFDKAKKPKASVNENETLKNNNKLA